MAFSTNSVNAVSGDCLISTPDASSITITNGLGSGPMWGSTSTINYVGSSVQPSDYAITNGAGTKVVSVPRNSSTLEVNGSITLNGEDLNDRLSRIETMLQIPTRDAIIEAQYPKLKALFNEYMQELEKYKTWNRITKGTEK